MARGRVQTVLAVMVLAFAIVWFFAIASQLLKLPEDFVYRADVFSYDRFYDESTGAYQDEITSETLFLYLPVSVDGNILLLKNTFDVRTSLGQGIFSVERIYGVDRKTAMHVPGYGDRNRTGYLFAPRGLESGQNFTYWHINYDTPAEMKFVRETEIQGLKVYHYRAQFNADQTANLGNLPGVPESRGINLDVVLDTWVEPVSGRIVKYEDHSIAYYYDIQTGERIHPWNKFHNEYTPASITSQVEIAKAEKQKLFLVEVLVPFIIVLLSLAIFVHGLIYSKN